MSKTAKLDCESEDMQIRFWEQAKGLRDSRRFAVGFFMRPKIPASFFQMEATVKISPFFRYDFPLKKRIVYGLRFWNMIAILVTKAARMV